MHPQIEKVLKMVDNEALRKVVLNVMADHHDNFIIQPAGCSTHHSYKGGLLQHSCDTAKLAGLLADRYRKQYSPPLNKSLMVVGALLHDLGKVVCYFKNEKGLYESTRKSKLHHHIPLGYHYLANVTDKLVANGEMKEKVADHLLHIIISHHGRIEYSSPRKPKTREAFLIAQADLIDAYMGAPEQARSTFNKRGR